MVNKQLIKRYAISSAVTFATGFAMVFVAQIDDITMDSFRDGSIIGLFFVSARMGVKTVLETFLAWRTKSA